MRKFSRLLNNLLFTQFAVAYKIQHPLFGIASRYVAAKRKSLDFHIQNYRTVRIIGIFSVGTYTGTRSNKHGFPAKSRAEEYK